MLDNTSQLLLRNIDFLSGKVLLVEPYGRPPCC